MRLLNILLIILFFLAFLGSLFYWFEWRPSNIRKDCYSRLMKIKDERINTDNPLTNEEANNLFRRCLVKEGLNAEDLVK